LNALKALIEEPNKLLEEYTYIKAKVEDLLYIQTGVELDDFHANCLRLGLMKNEKWAKRNRDYEEISQ